MQGAEERCRELGKDAEILAVKSFSVPSPRCSELWQCVHGQCQVRPGDQEQDRGTCRGESGSAQVSWMDSARGICSAALEGPLGWASPSWTFRPQRVSAWLWSLIPPDVRRNPEGSCKPNCSGASAKGRAGTSVGWEQQSQSSRIPCQGTGCATRHPSPTWAWRCRPSQHGGE